MCIRDRNSAVQPDRNGSVGAARRCELLDLCRGERFRDLGVLLPGGLTHCEVRGWDRSTAICAHGATSAIAAGPECPDPSSSRGVAIAVWLHAQRQPSATDALTVPLHMFGIGVST